MCVQGVDIFALVEGTETDEIQQILGKNILGCIVQLNQNQFPLSKDQIELTSVSFLI